MAWSRKVLGSFINVTCLINIALTTPLTSRIKGADLLKRHRRTISHQPIFIGCVEMTGQEGEYVFLSSGSDAVCGFYVIGDVDSLVQIEMMDFNLRCEEGGLMEVVDGWVLQGELFPSPEEDQGGFDARYRTYCGYEVPPALLTSSQNAAMIQFRVPLPGEGFRFRVRFLRNPQPCNVLAPVETTTITMSNFGSHGNCTTQVIFPVNVRLVNVDVKTTSRVARMRRVMDGLSVHCQGASGPDFAALTFGTGLDTAYFQTRMAFCGRRTRQSLKHVTLGCTNSAIRLVSSGQYNNSITLAISTPAEEEVDAFQRKHPTCFLPN